MSEEETSCEVCGGNVKVESNRSLSRYYINLDKLTIEKLKQENEILKEAQNFKCAADLISRMEEIRHSRRLTDAKCEKLKQENEKLKGLFEDSLKILSNTHAYLAPESSIMAVQIKEDISKLVYKVKISNSRG